MIVDEPVVVDWTRRKVLRLAEELTASHCVHHSRLWEWCPDCSADIDHGDRAVVACMGGWRGHTELATVPRCHCQGYTAGELRRRRAA